MAVEKSGAHCTEDISEQATNMGLQVGKGVISRIQ